MNQLNLKVNDLMYVCVEIFMFMCLDMHVILFQYLINFCTFIIKNIILLKLIKKSF